MTSDDLDRDAGQETPRLRVLLADDQALVRAGLRTMLEAGGCEVVAAVGDGAHAVSAARRLRPDVCLLDIRMPVLDGLAATRQLAGPDVADPLAVVVVTTFDRDEYVREALANGARGFILKDAGPGLLLEAVHAAARGDALISPAITVRLLRHFAEEPKERRVIQPIDPLSEREEQVLRLVATGQANREIATELSISLATVKSHLHHLSTKLGARNRVELAAWAWDTGRMQPPRDR